MVIEVFKATPEMAAEIKKIERECGLEPWSVGDYETETQRKESVFLVVGDRSKRRMAGFAIMRLITITDGSDNDLDTVLEGEILNIAVRREFRRRGLGASLLRDLQERLLKKKGKSMILDVRKSNREAIAFYTDSGFVEIAQRAGFYSRPPEDALTLRSSFGQKSCQKSAI